MTSDQIAEAQKLVVACKPKTNYSIVTFIDKSHDIATSGPVVLTPDLSKLKVVGLTREMAESYVPMNITVSYAGQDGTPKPFLMIINWIKTAKDWKIASEIILPVPPAPAPAVRG
jgi:hypothetical protein